MKTKQEDHNCIVCGARTKFGTTCDSICARAVKTRRTRQDQIKAEMQASARADRARALSDQLLTRLAHIASEDLDYNRPYLKYA